VCGSFFVSSQRVKVSVQMGGLYVKGKMLSFFVVLSRHSLIMCEE
jgi:hypothetical protein